MTQFIIPELGPSLSKRLFNTNPTNDCEKAGFYVSSIPTYLVYWTGRAVKEINILSERLENACKYDDVDTISKKIAKYVGNIIGKITLLSAATAAYLTFSAVSALDLIGIAIRTLALPIGEHENSEVENEDSSPVILKIRLVDASKVTIEKAGEASDANVVILIDDQRQKTEKSIEVSSERQHYEVAVEKPLQDTDSLQHQLDTLTTNSADPKEVPGVGSHTTMTYPAFVPQKAQPAA